MIGESDLSGKVVLLTGCTGKLGSAYTEALLNQGVKLIAVDLAAAKPKTFLEKKAEKYASMLDVYEVDVSSEESIASLFDLIKLNYDSIDVVINNAAATGEYLMKEGDAFAPLDKYPLEIWQKVIDINLTGTFLITKHAIPFLASGASIINVSSIYGVVAPDQRVYEGLDFNSFAAYAASKAGVHGFTQWLSTYLAHKGIRANTLVPGGVFNGQDPIFVERYNQRTPLGRMAKPQDMIGMVIFLCSSSSSYCTGQKFIVDGGLTVW